eukprot:SAG25_NODE_2446_length_1598_cov_1.340227_3_plen_198_part_00
MLRPFVSTSTSTSTLLALALLVGAPSPAAAVGTVVKNSAEPCLVVHDTSAAQDLRIEAHGANSLRVRAVPSGGAFKDAPDVVSAFTPLGDDGTGSMLLSAQCATTVLDSAAGASVSNGNLKAAVGADGKLVFTRISDGRALLVEKRVRVLAPTATVPPVQGFLSLDMEFEAVEGERICKCCQPLSTPATTLPLYPFC